MDNLTHSLIGVAVARTALSWRTRKRKRNASASATSPLLDRLTVLTSVVASNIPDIDGILPRVFPHFDPRLIYLTHHRGLTHTLLFLLPIAALSLGLTRWMTIRADPGGREFRGALKFLGVVAILALVCHVGADAWNDYGVHPFSPFWNRWFYGGFIFIIEPLLWSALLAWLIATGRTRAGRVFSGFALGCSMLLLWSNPMTSQSLWPVALCGSIWGLGQLLAQRRIKSLKLAWSSVFAVLAMFFSGRELTRAKFAGEAWSDISTTPAPTNPFCWKVILVDAGGASYRARVGVVSLWPAVVRADSCFGLGMEKGLAPLEPVAGDGAAYFWKGEFSAPWSELTALARKDCRVERLMGFLRVPYWFRNGNGQTVVGDLRYDRESGGFTEMIFDGAPFTDCPTRAYPQWDWPVSRNARRS